MRPDAGCKSMMEPPPAPTLVSLEKTVEPLREHFNAASGARFVALLSPTSEGGIAGVVAIRVLARLHEFGDLGRPVVVGSSRQGFLSRPIGRDLAAADRDWATAASVTAAVLAGAHVVRVHAVREMNHAVRVADEIRKYHRES
jgi:dihydropteroate synthase